jgi:spermidine/putrescine transport system substrate-binding protein
MLRKILLMLCLSMLVLGIPVLAQDTSWTCPPGFEGQTLTWFNWTTYEAENTRSNFTALCGLSNTAEEIMGSNEDLIAKLGQGNPGYDVVTPTGTFIPQMVRENMLIPLDMSKIPNFANVSEFLKNPSYDPDNQYTVPYQWGTIGIGYNREAVGGEITTWDDVWNYQGNVAWLEDPRAMMGIALDLLGLDPNSTNADEIGQARDYLIDRGSNVRSIAVDDGQEKLLSGEADIVVEYSGDIFQIISDCDANPDQNCAGKFAFVLPTEGSVLWVDNLAIPKDAPNPDLAMAFIDYILDPQVGADISNFTAYATPNQKSIDDKLIDEAMLTDPIIYPTEEVSQNLFTVVDVGDEAARLYNDAWTELKVLLGQ